MRACRSKSKRLSPSEWENPARGCLFIDARASDDQSFFVFRRRGLMKLSQPAIWSWIFKGAEIAEAAPPKNKKRDRKGDKALSNPSSFAKGPHE